MARLVYTALMSLDGYIEDEGGRFDWAMPDADLHAFVNDLTVPVGTHLYGRRMYETMQVWQTMGLERGTAPPELVESGELGRGAKKIVSPPPPQAVPPPRPRLERTFDAAAVGHLKATAERDISVSGP